MHWPYLMAYGSSKQCVKNMKAEEGGSLRILFCTSFSSCDIQENALYENIQIRPFLFSKGNESDIVRDFGLRSASV